MREPEHTTAFSFKRVGTQGLMLFGGYGLAQALSFARNALLGHALSPRDFGIAASIALLLQLVETLSDLGHDRLIVQADDGGDDSFVATTHTVLIARGIVLAAVLAALGPLTAHFFGVAEAAGAFAVLALVPLIRGFMHLDCRRAQRQLDNRPQLIVEVVPQAIALTAALPLLWIAPGFEIVVALAVVQAIAAVAMARAVATKPYSLAWRPDVVRRLVAFGWPILISALPLIAVYQGDRAIIGRLAGMEALAAYSAAFMVTMVPGLLAARAGHALMLPVFAQALRRGEPLARSYTTMSEVTTLMAAVYLTGFVIAGGALLPLAFGEHYHGLGAVTSWLAAMWAMRMLQAVPGMALMAAGETKPFLIAGLIRAAVLPIVLYAALHGAGLPIIAAIGCAGEAASLVYVCWRMGRLEKGLAAILPLRALFLLPAGLCALLASQLSGGLMASSLIAALTALMIMACGIAVMPALLTHTRRLLKRSAVAVADQV